jgi:polyhydroxybutyrate depolymerase
MHGTDDSVVPFDQGIRQDIATWVKRDGCIGPPISSQLPDVDPLDRTRTRVDVFGSCASGTEVAFYAIEGGGHAWPGGDEPLRSVLRPGHAPSDFDAGVLIWDFFEKHPRR